MSNDDPGSVDYEVHDRIAYITLNRPAQLNAFTDDLVVKFRRAIERLDADDAADVAILSGAGRAFSSGADVRQRQMRPPEEMRRLGRPSGRGDADGEGILYEVVNWKPVIAAVHGYAVGMGLSVMLECDIIVATASAQFQVTEVPRGLWGSRHWALLYFRSNATFADDVVLTGRFFSAAEALQRGVINASVEDGAHIAKAEEYARQMLANPVLAVRAAVRARRWYMQKFEQQDQPLLRAGFPLHLTDDFRRNAAAFFERHEQHS